MIQTELDQVIVLHSIWLKTNGKKGTEADLKGTNLREADLKGTNLRDANLKWADLRGADLRGADLRGADLRGADLREADLRDANLGEANLREADLREADFNFSCLPLWCGGANFKIDAKLMYQIVAHICSLECEDKDFKKFKDLNMKFAKKSHIYRDLFLK